MELEINLDNVNELLDTAIATRGEGYVYNEDNDSCVYMNDDGSASCLIGVMFTQLGCTFEVPTGDSAVGYFMLAGPLDYAREDLEAANPGLTITDDALVVLRAAQTVQDNGGTWGLASSVAYMLKRTLETINKGKA